MKLIIAPNAVITEAQVKDIVTRFNETGTLLVKGKRNTIKIFRLEDIEVNVKSFKKPHWFNSVVYAYFRKSKARRSFEYANYLIEKNIGTPKPLAFVEYTSLSGLDKSYYLCEHIYADLTFRELVEVPDFPDHENILRQFTRFSFILHENGVEFKDHSPGNTLIKKVSGSDRYDFFLVDLNRMNFHESMPFELRMKNLSRLTPKKEMVEIMANEYAKFYKEKSEKEIFEQMWGETEQFQYKFHRKQALKKKLKFWKK